MREHGDNTKKKANTKSQSDEPAEQRMPIFGTGAEPSSGGWLHSLVLGLCFLLLTLWAEWFVEGMRAKILTLAVGFTVVVWTVAGVKLWQLRGSPDKPKTPTSSRPLLKTSEAPSTTAAQLPHNIEPAASGAKAPPPKLHPPKERNKVIIGQPGKADGQEPKDLPAAPAEPDTFREKIENFTFSLGAGGVSVSYTIDALRAGPKAPFDFGDYHPVWVYLENEKLFADCDVYGGPGLSPVEVKKNEFVVRPPNWDRNFTNKALEIVDSQQNPVFQFIYKTPSHIVVNGIFPTPGGFVLANENGMFINRTAVPVYFRLRRIFKYPSWKYPGQYEEPSN